MAARPLGNRHSCLVDVQQLTNLQPVDARSALTDLNYLQHQSATMQGRKNADTSTCFGCLHGNCTMSAGLGGRKDVFYDPGFTFLNCFTYKSTGKGWLKGFFWDSAVTALNTTDAKCAPDHWRNTDEGLNGVTVLQLPAERYELLTDFVVSAALRSCHD